ncbi:MAG TPA: hypothetical protein PK156_33745 [Polyangium sp.]|nr:hypothetical protein [Polyangium sp.]
MMNGKICRKLDVWLKSNNIATSPLTDTDWLALEAFIHLMALWASADHPREVLEAAACTLHQMQPQSRYVAKKAIPYALDWLDEDKLWPFIQTKLEMLEAGRS